MENISLDIERLIGESLLAAGNSDEVTFFLQKRVRLESMSVGDQQRKFVFLIACDNLHALIFDPDEEDFGLAEINADKSILSVELIGPFLASAREFYIRRTIV